MRIFRSFTCSSLILVGLMACSKVGNNKLAHYTIGTSLYRIELKGQRRLMVHDPISALIEKTYEETYLIDTPRIKGVVEGREIPVEPGHYKYLGNITFSGNKMQLALYYDNTDEHKKEALFWNGEYILEQKRTVPARSS